jgi:polyisoprenoid-binding protein YceI
MVTTVRGDVTDFDATPHVDTETPANSRVTLTIRTASINTASADRDGTDWTITGDLTIRLRQLGHLHNPAGK